MRSRFIYYLVASVLLHLVVLGLPFAVTTGGLASQGMLPVRVHLLTNGETIAGATAKQNEASAQKATSAPVKRDSTKSTMSPESPSTTEQLQTAMRSSRIEKERHHDPRHSQPQTMPVKPRTTNHPTNVALKEETTEDPKVSAINQGALSKKDTQVSSRKQPRRAAKMAASPIPTKPKRASLRTTTVYPGSAATQSSGKGAAEARTATKATQTGTQHATASTHQGGAQPSQPGSFSRVRYARVVKPEYPEHARAQGWEGTTVLKVLVDQGGRSEQVRVQRTSGFNVLDDAAVNAMTRWEFHPARDGHKAVQSWVSVPIVFKLKEEH